MLSNVRSLGTGTDCLTADCTMFGTKRRIRSVWQEAGRAFRLDLPAIDDNKKLKVSNDQTESSSRCTWATRRSAQVLLCLFESELDQTTTSEPQRQPRKTA